jgi:hypothetical protein
VVWQGRSREAPPYADCRPVFPTLKVALRSARASCSAHPTGLKLGGSALKNAHLKNKVPTKNQ